MWSPQGPAHRWLGQKGLLAPGITPNPPSPVLHVLPHGGARRPPPPLVPWPPTPEALGGVGPLCASSPSLESVRLEGEVNALIGGQLSVSYLERCVSWGKDLQGSCENCSTWGQLPVAWSRAQDAPHGS